METGRPRSSNEEEAHRATKQQKTTLAPSRCAERADSQLPEPQAWLPTPMLGGEPLMDDASIRDYNGGIGCHVASALEQTLLLPKDMVELRGFRKSCEVLGGMKSSFILKGFWAWYVLILPRCFSLFFFF